MCSCSRNILLLKCVNFTIAQHRGCVNGYLPLSVCWFTAVQFVPAGDVKWTKAIAGITIASVVSCPLFDAPSTSVPYPAYF